MSPELFRGVVPFVAAAEEGTFRAAGAKLGVSAAAISKAIAALEAETGALLFSRSGRSVSLTREGRELYACCAPAVRGVAAGRAALVAGRKQPEGELVLTAPFVAAPLCAPAIARLRERHPRLVFSLRVTDRVVRLGEEGVDAAIRIGSFPSSGLVARRLCGTTLWTVASPAYLARAGAPKRPDDLASHACVVAIGPRGKPFPWVFDDGLYEARSVLASDYAPSLVDATLAGVGVTQLFDFMASRLVDEGKLVRLLEDRTGAGPDVIAVCEPGHKSSARVRALFDALVETASASERALRGRARASAS